MYQINGLLKLAFEDNWEQGELDNGYMSTIDTVFSATTIDELLANVAKFIGVKMEDVDRNAGNDTGEPGRVDLQRQENGHGNRPSPSQIAAWKRGTMNLWNATYSGYVEEVRRVSL